MNLIYKGMNILRDLCKKLLLCGAIVGGFNPYLNAKASTNQSILNEVNEIYSEEVEFYSVDDKAPEIKSLKVDKNVVKAGDVVKLSIDVIDDLSAIQTVQVVYQKPISKNSKSLFLEYNSETKLYESVISVDETAEVGEWKIDFIFVCDTRDNCDWIYNTKLNPANQGKDLSQGNFTVSYHLKPGWLKDGATWYYVKDNGTFVTGWEKVSGTWYYFNPSGAMQTGWLKEGKTWYYLKSSGAMATGWEKVNGTWYYFNPSGAMQTGWLKEGRKWYYLKPSGAMVIGVEKIEGTYYYFNSSGVMQKNLGSNFDINKYNQLISSGKSPSYALNSILYPNVKTNFYKDIRVLKDPSSLTALVNKNFQLPCSYVPNDLVLLDVPLYNNSSSNLANYMRSEAAVALKKMFNAAKAEKGYKLVARSGYRSYKTQESLYNNYVSNKGQVWADTYSARPGHSEHQTGLAIDITSPTVNNSLSDSFGTTAEGKWVAQNAHRFGYILRYPQGRKSEVGYEYEPWHLRYVGVEIATEIYNSGLIYEDYVLEKGLIPSVQ